MKSKIHFVMLSISTRNPDFWGQIKWACRNAADVSGSYNPGHNELYNLIRETYVKLGCPFTNTPEQRAWVSKQIREKYREHENGENILHP